LLKADRADRNIVIKVINLFERISMSVYAFVAVGIGAMLGAWLRWILSILLNPLFPSLPPGTLTANLVGAYLIGVFIALFEQHPAISPEIKLFIITGFLGGLTTFSTFSAESIGLINRAQYLAALTHIFFHFVGSLSMTVLGIATIKWLRLS
jgi:CrcB protein